MLDDRWFSDFLRLVFSEYRGTGFRWSAFLWFLQDHFVSSGAKKKKKTIYKYPVPIAILRLVCMVTLHDKKLYFFFFLEFILSISVRWCM